MQEVALGMSEHGVDAIVAGARAGLRCTYVYGSELFDYGLCQFVCVGVVGMAHGIVQ